MIDKECPFCHNILNYHGDKGNINAKFLRLECRNSECHIHTFSYFNKFVCSIDLETKEIGFYSANIKINNKLYCLQSRSKSYMPDNYGTKLYLWMLTKDHYLCDRYMMPVHSVISIKEFYPLSSKEELTNITTRLLKLITFI